MVAKDSLLFMMLCANTGAVAHILCRACRFIANFSCNYLSFSRLFSLSIYAC